MLCGMSSLVGLVIFACQVDGCLTRVNSGHEDFNENRPPQHHEMTILA